MAPLNHVVKALLITTDNQHICVRETERDAVNEPDHCPYIQHNRSNMTKLKASTDLSSHPHTRTSRRVALAQT